MAPETNPSHAGDREEIALTAYLNAILAIAKCMGEVCPREGLIFSYRLQRLPRRLAFNATPQAMEESREALEADLAEYAQAACAWIDAGAGLAREILAGVAALPQGADDRPAPREAMLLDLAEQMEVAAEVDGEADVRAGLRRWAASLRSYQSKHGNGAVSLSGDVERLAARLADWLARANPALIVDPATGLLNREETERQLQISLNAGRLFSVLVFTWDSVQPNPVVKQLADSLVGLVRPRDVVGRWEANQLAVIFECSAGEAAARAAKMSDWLSGGYSVVVDGAVVKARVEVTVTVAERRPEDTLVTLVERIGSALTTPAGGNTREPVPA
ncbi:MAG TPA: hypothetical protein VMB25_24050 [Bryobacteraceae bacterium]|nr:hypothetical protein [Bryobacteraceae bacterium]